MLTYGKNNLCIRPTFGLNRLFYFVGPEGHVRIALCGHAPRTVLLCYMFYG